MVSLDIVRTWPRLMELMRVKRQFSTKEAVACCACKLPNAGLYDALGYNRANSSTLITDGLKHLPTTV